MQIQGPIAAFQSLWDSQHHLAAWFAPSPNALFSPQALDFEQKHRVPLPGSLTGSFPKTSEEETAPGCPKTGASTGEILGWGCPWNNGHQGLIRVTPPQAAGEGTQGLGGEGGGTTAGFERETPDRWGCPRFHDWLPLSWLPAPSPRPTPLPSGGSPVGTRGGGRGNVPSPRRGCGNPQPGASAPASSCVLNAPSTPSGPKMSPLVTRAGTALCQGGGGFAATSFCMPRAQHLPPPLPPPPQQLVSLNPPPDFFPSPLCSPKKLWGGFGVQPQQGLG